MSIYFTKMSFSADSMSTKVLILLHYVDYVDFSGDFLYPTIYISLQKHPLYFGLKIDIFDIIIDYQLVILLKST